MVSAQTTPGIFIKEGGEVDGSLLSLLMSVEEISPVENLLATGKGTCQVWRLVAQLMPSLLTGLVK